MKRFFSLAVLLLAVVLPLQAHTTPEMAAVRLTVLTWTNALLIADAEDIASVQHEDFAPVGDVGLFLMGLRAGVIQADGVDLRHAVHENLPDGDLRVSPIVFQSGVGSEDLFLSLVLRRVVDDWKILRAEPAADLPAEYADRDLPEHHARRAVTVRLVDDATGHGVAGRIHVHDSRGEYWPPRGHMKNIALGWRQDVGGDVKIDGETWAYVEPETVVELAAGSYVLEASRGIEYEGTELTFEVGADETPAPEVRLGRWVHMAAEGWYSGDTHIHFLSPTNAAREGRGEDVNVVNVLATKWGELITDVEHFTGATDVRSEDDYIVYYNEESRHGFLGHTILLNLKELVYPLSWGEGLEGVRGGYDYPPMAHQADKTHAQGGHVTWAHFPFPNGELAVDVALGKVDSIDLMTWGDAFSDTSLQPGMPGSAPTWYRFLNCGFRLAATAGTDKMWNNQIVGSPRVYVKVDGELTYQKWIDGIQAGRTFTTTGPMLEMTAGGLGLGETIAASAGETIAVETRLRTHLPVDHVEIVVGGEIVAQEEVPEGRGEFTFETEIEVSKSTWIAARAYAPGPLPYQAMFFLGQPGIPIFAHTSPVYVEVGGEPARSAEDAAYFIAWCDTAIEWAKTRARFRSDEERREMIALFERAKAIYAAQSSL